MAQARLSASVTVETPPGVTVAPRTGEGALGLDAVHVDASPLGQALAAAGLSLAADFDLRPTSAAPSATLGAHASPVKVEVSVKADESALLLLETDGGVLAWSYPQARVHKTSPGLGLAPAGAAAATLVFDLTPASPAAGAAFSFKGIGGSPIWDWVVRKTIGVVRTRVLKFVVGKIEDAIVDHIEGGLKLGLTSLAEADPIQWRALDHAPTVRAGQGPPRILLMVHGTFSTTAGSFSALTTTAEGQAFLAAARSQYDAVWGFDHKTLGQGVEQNARAMLDALDPLLPQGAIIDAVAYSRGGLVYRAFAEALLPARRPDIKIGKAAFVGCTNGGTHLAEPDNWETLVDLYTNIVMASSRIVSAVAGGGALSPIVSEVIETIAQFIKYFAVVGVTDRRVPGLADMEPGSALVKALNTATHPAAPIDYFAVTSNFKPTFDPEKGLTKELEQMLLDRVTNRLFQTDNDLVVDTASMTMLGKLQARLKDSDIFRFGDVEDIYHTVYFGSPQTATKLREWLI
jgi:hypothetical protein